MSKPKATKICYTCGIGIARKNGKFCSRSCFAKGNIKKINAKCLSCGKEFKAKLSKASIGHGKYCSRSCFHKSLIRQVGRSCETCGNYFSVNNYRAKVGIDKYCSIGCSVIGKSKKLTKDCESKDCEFCGNNFKSIRKKRFCSSSCRYSFISKKMDKRKEKECESCSKVFYTKDGRYCSIECAGKARSVNMESYFLEKILVPENSEGCWIWMGSRHKQGYGIFRIKEESVNKVILMHRYSYERWYGPILNGLHCLHTCDVTSCVRPDHLFLGTHGDNMIDKVKKRRQPRKLRPDDVLEIRVLYSLGGSNFTELANEYGVCNTTIHGILFGKTWKYV